MDGRRPYLAEEEPFLGRTAAVGSYGPNAWNLHDMHGNVWEWVGDWYAEQRTKDVYGGALGSEGSTSKPIDSVTAGHLEGLMKSGGSDIRGPASGTHKVMRGGAYLGSVGGCRSACRRSREPDFRDRTIGFRVVRVGADPGGK